MAAESKVTVEVDGQTLALTNLDKVLYPEAGFTKGEVIDYYVSVADVLLPHLADRLLTRKRWPDGTGTQPFFEKNAPRGTPDLGAHRRSWPSTATTASTTSSPTTCRRWSGWPTWLRSSCTCRSGRSADDGSPQEPTSLVFDLDPGPPADDRRVLRRRAGAAHAAGARTA